METNNFIKIDECVLKTLRYSFLKNAIKFLRRNSIEFIEGKSCDDENADFVVQRVCKQMLTNKRGGLNKQVLLVRNNALKKWLNFKQSKMKQKPTETGVVYFIHEENDFTQFKIGFSSNLEDRLGILQVGNPRNLVVYKTIPNMSRKQEKEMQDFFAAYHIRGEWYRITVDMIEIVCL